MLPTAFVLALTSSSPLLSQRTLAGLSALQASIRSNNSSSSSLSRKLTRAGTMAAATAVSFIDIGANLLDDCFQGKYNGGSQKHEPDLDGVLERASATGVEKVRNRDVHC